MLQGGGGAGSQRKVLGVATPAASVQAVHSRVRVRVLQAVAGELSPPLQTSVP